MDGLLVAFGLQEQQLCDDQAGHAIIDLQVEEGRVGDVFTWEARRGQGGECFHMDGKERAKEAVVGWLQMSQGTRMGVRAQVRPVGKNSGSRRCLAHRKG